MRPRRSAASFRPRGARAAAAALLGAALMFGPGVASAQGTPPERAAPGAMPDAMPAALAPAVARAEFLGRQMYLHDRAAWLATDAMLADTRMRAAKDRVGGWVTEPTAHGVRVIFFSRDDAPVRLYEIEMDARETLSEPTVESPEPLTAEQRAQSRARDTVRAQAFAACAASYNAVTMPSAEGIRVYLMPGFSTPGVYPLGGYHVYVTDGGGDTVVSSHAFGDACLDHTDAAARDGAGASIQSSAPQPTEVHVFVSMYADTPLIVVGADDGPTWSVEKGRVSLLRAAK